MGDQPGVFESDHIRLQGKSDNIRFKSFCDRTRLRARPLVGLLERYCLTRLFLPLLLEDRDQFPVGFAWCGIGCEDQFDLIAICLWTCIRGAACSQDRDQ
jgi:hypothetical protein